jgi:erythromycin esterase-like protein
VEDHHYLVSRIDHGSTGFWFIFGVITSSYSDFRFVSKWIPTSLKDTNDAPAVKRSEQARHFVEWLQDVKRHHEAPDLRAAVGDQLAMVSGAASDGDRLFDPAERALLAARIDQLERQITEIAKPNSDQQVYVQVVMEQAKATSGQVSRTE